MAYIVVIGVIAMIVLAMLLPAWLRWRRREQMIAARARACCRADRSAPMGAAVR